MRNQVFHYAETVFMETQFVDSRFHLGEDKIVKQHFVSDVILLKEFLYYMCPLLVL
jgi:hypothetical protein